tara:strand:- start:4 stop:564 length:561 start_codon:yes stop_codon:yes gene_type:complete
MLNDLKILLENESSDEPIKVGQFRKTGKLSLVSADDQIDSYLIKMQFGAVDAQKKEDSEDKDEVSDETISESLLNYNLKTLLKEEEGEGFTDSSAIDVKEPAASEDVVINVSSFAKHVKEFVNLAHDRLDIPSVIVNRARNLVKDKHPDAVEAFDKALKEVQLGGESRFENTPDNSFQPGAMGGGA